VPAGADEPSRLLDVVAADWHQREPGDRALRADLLHTAIPEPTLRRLITR